GSQEPLVVKWILPHLSSDPSFVQMLLNEARIAARLNHPNVARILDLGEADGTYYIAMEYVRGEDLGQVMRQAWKAGQRTSRPVDHRADIFSAGLVLYELLSGVRPLQRGTEAGTHIAAVQCQIEPPSAVSETPRELDAVVMGALQRAPEDRYATALEMKRAID